jgi:ParB-like chromosome segregation protein Spo0J
MKKLETKNNEEQADIFSGSLFTRDDEQYLVDIFIADISERINCALDGISQELTIYAINEIRAKIHALSPFKDEPVDFVRWVKNDNVKANDYNPNSVAPPEMKLLELSISNDGFTQPIVSWPHDDYVEVVDGFHRHRVGKESILVNERVKGYLPIVAIKESQQGQNDRVASTIRHNRARGKHKVESMSEIVVDLKRRNWSDKKIAIELGMDQDEVLRLCQISGLAEMFKDHEFSEAWEAVELSDDDFNGDFDEID